MQRSVRARVPLVAQSRLLNLALDLFFLVADLLDDKSLASLDCAHKTVRPLLQRLMRRRLTRGGRLPLQADGWPWECITDITSIDATYTRPSQLYGLIEALQLPRTAVLKQLRLVCTEAPECTTTGHMCSRALRQLFKLSVLQWLEVLEVPFLHLYIGDERVLIRFRNLRVLHVATAEDLEVLSPVAHALERLSLLGHCDGCSPHGLRISRSSIFVASERFTRLTELSLSLDHIDQYDDTRATRRFITDLFRLPRLQKLTLLTDPVLHADFAVRCHDMDSPPTPEAPALSEYIGPIVPFRAPRLKRATFTHVDERLDVQAFRSGLPSGLKSSNASVRYPDLCGNPNGRMTCSYSMLTTHQWDDFDIVMGMLS